MFAMGAVALAIVGYATDQAIGHDAFARSGSLIVAYGAALVSRQVYNTERQIARNQARVEKIEATYLDAASDKGEGHSPEAFSRLAVALGDFRNARLAQMGRLVHTEIAIVCGGTLIWGFGDLVV